MSNRKLFTWPVRVYFEDTDHSGIVYHANYLRYLERTRTEWLRSLGVNQPQMLEAFGVYFTLSDFSLKYHRPAVFDDELLVTAAASKIGRASVTIEQQIWRGGLDAELICSGQTRAAVIEAGTLKLKPLPKGMVELFNVTTD